MARRRPNLAATLGMASTTHAKSDAVSTTGSAIERKPASTFYVRFELLTEDGDPTNN